MVNFGYNNNAYYLLPIHINKKTVFGHYPIHVKVDWLVCDKECVPQDESFDFTLQVSRQSIPSANQILINQIKNQLPENYPQPIFYFSKNRSIYLKLPNSNPIEKLFFFPKQKNIIQSSAQQILSKNGRDYLLKMAPDFNQKFSSLSGILSVTQGKEVSFYKVHANGSGNKVSNSFWGIIFLAILGGIILNIMPCVFPVLSLKALAICNTRNKIYKRNVLDGIFYTIGILICFFIIAIIFLGLKATGSSIAWGYQMQSPITISLLIYLFFIISLNLLGIFEIGISFIKIGKIVTGKENYITSFLTGILAAIIATPCTEPFMGAAIVFALTQPAIIMISIILALGFGLALPILLISLIPKLSKLLPRPGEWMNTFKEFLAFPILISCAWLLWVLTQQVSHYQCIINFYWINLNCI